MSKKTIVPKKIQYIDEDKNLKNQVQLRNFIKSEKKYNQAEIVVLKLLEKDIDLTEHLFEDSLVGRFLHVILERLDVRTEIFQKGLDKYINQGGSLEVENNEGLTPLHVACEKGKLAEVKLLLGRGAKEQNITEKLENSDKRIKKLSELLKKYNIAPESDSLNPQKYKIEVLNSMIKKELNLKQKISSSKSALHLAAKAYNCELVEFLIDKGFDIERKNEKGETVLFTAFNQLDMDMVQLLLKKGANVLAKDNYDNTIMHHACLSNDGKSVNLFIKHGGLLFDRNKAGKLPVDLCISKNTKEEMQKIYNSINSTCEDVAKELSSDFLNAVSTLENFFLDKKGISKGQFVKSVLNYFTKGTIELAKQDYFIISTLAEFLGDEVVEINRRVDSPLTIKVIGCHNNFIKPENFKAIIVSPEISLEMILTVFCTLPRKSGSNYDLVKKSINELIEDAKDNSLKEKYSLIDRKISIITENVLHEDLYFLNSHLDLLVCIFDDFKNDKKQKNTQLIEDFKLQQDKFFLKISNPYQHLKKINSFWQESGEEFLAKLQQDEHLSLGIGYLINNIKLWMKTHGQNNVALCSQLKKLDILDKEVLEIEIIETKSDFLSNNINNLAIEEKKKIFSLTEEEECLIAADISETENKIKGFIEPKVNQQQDNGLEVDDELFYEFFGITTNDEETKVVGGDKEDLIDEN